MRFELLISPSSFANISLTLCQFQLKTATENRQANKFINPALFSCSINSPVSSKAELEVCITYSSFLTEWEVEINNKQPTSSFMQVWEHKHWRVNKSPDTYLTPLNNSCQQGLVSFSKPSSALLLLPQSKVTS